MRILDKYICREVFSHSLLGLAIFTFVFFVPQLVRLMELIVRHSSGASSIALAVSVLTYARAGVYAADGYVGGRADRPWAALRG